MPDSRDPRGLDAALATDDPGGWLGNAGLLDLEDPKLRLRAHALTQLCKTEREKALAGPLGLRPQGRREVVGTEGFGRFGGGGSAAFHARDSTREGPRPSSPRM